MTEANLHHNRELNLHEHERSIAVANQNSALARIVNIIYFLFGTLQLLLVVRVILHLIGANAGNGFASFINGLTAPFVAFLANLVQNPVLSTTAALEITTIIVIIVYASLAWLIGHVVWLALSRPRKMLRRYDITNLIWFSVDDATGST